MFWVIVCLFHPWRVLNLKREKVYQAALLDPHTSEEQSMDDIVSLCNDLIEAHGNWLPQLS
jgi:alpha-galactosidase